MSDYGAGFANGYASGKSSSSGVGAGLALVGMVLVALFAVAAASYLVLFPAASAVVLVAFAVMAWSFSALASVIWHDPSPFHLFGLSWLYLNWVAVALSVVLGVALAVFAVPGIEDRLARNATYVLARHVWRVASASALVAACLFLTRERTGITGIGLWLIPLFAALGMHLAFRSVFPSRVRNWLGIGR